MACVSRHLINATVLVKWREFQELQMYRIGAGKLQRAILPWWWSLNNFCGRAGGPPAATVQGHVRCLNTVGTMWIKRNQENQLMSNRMLSRSSLEEWCFTCLYWFFAQHQFHRIFCENKRVTATEDLQESLSWSWRQIMESLWVHVHGAEQARCSSWNSYLGFSIWVWTQNSHLDFGDV